MLRAGALIVALCALAAALWSALTNGFGWPFVAWTAILAAALAFERRKYGAASPGAPGPGWRATDERFVDDATGRMVRVWFDPATGERRYVEADD